MCPECKDLIDLFWEYREHFGIDESDDLEKSCEYEDKFREILCRHEGHIIYPDQCGIPEHDYCYRCSKGIVEIENDGDKIKSHARKEGED